MTRTNRIAALFPGQGSQSVGMAKELTEQFIEAKRTYEEASDSIRFNLLKLCLEGPADELQLTFNAQPAILTTSLAWFRVLKERLGFTPDCGGGHSLGEYSALVAAGATTLAEAVPLVRKRGELMQSAVPLGVGKMAAVLGLADEVVNEVCRAATQSESSLAVPANFNSPGQVVIAGHASAVDRVQSLVTSSDCRPEWRARKFIPLNVSAPFHCPLLQPVAEAFLPHLQGIGWAPSKFAIASNVDGKVRLVNNGNEWIGLLKEQIDHPVLWTTCAQNLKAHGADIFVEMGPGKVLSGLVKRTVEGGTFLSVDSYKDFQALEKAMKENFQ